MTINSQSFSLPFEISREVETALQEWQVEDRVRRLWAGDTSLWTSADEDRWLGWLGIINKQLRGLERFNSLADEVSESRFTDAVLVGMGGSSLCAEVLRSAFPRRLGLPDLIVLDSTDPAQITACRNRIDLERALFIVSSKSGTTLESRILMQYFLDQLSSQVGASDAGSHFIAITDPSSELETIATERDFRHVFRGEPDIGGRFSALSDFGMVPAAIMGVDVGRFLGQARIMSDATSAEVDAPRNPAVVLGLILGVASKSGRDKVTIVSSPAIAGIGAWLEQLLAESTGKDGTGLIPVDGELLSSPEAYREDRIFVYLRLSTAPDQEHDDVIAAIEEAGNAVVRIELEDAYALGQEFFRWELATAVAGSYLGVHPFDQPDVEASKVEARRLTTTYESSGVLAEEPPLWQGDGVRLYADTQNSTTLKRVTGPRPVLADYLGAHLDRIVAGDYFGILAYTEMNRENQACLHELRHAVRNSKHVATSVGFGPRFLHSTGQCHKGGPNSGVFLQITCDDSDDLPVPGEGYTFGVVKAAQASGDLAVLAERGRRILRVHLSDPLQGLALIRDTIVGLMAS